MKPTRASLFQPAAPIWSRRTFLAITLGAAAHACVQSQEPDLVRQWRELDQRFLKVVGELRLSDEIGRAYLSKTSLDLPNPSVDGLLERLRLRLVAPGQIRDGHPDKEEVLRILATAIRDDFAEGRICVVQNWYLSLTECQAAAINFLNRGGEVGGTILDGYSTEILCEITDWGPHSTIQGEAFNLQPDGSSAFWMRTAGAPSDARVLLGSISLKTTVTESTVTADLQPAQSSLVLDRVGTYPVYLVSDGALEMQHVGEFQVLAKPPVETIVLDSLKLETIAGVKDWGPRQASVGVGFNVQPGGESAFWVRVAQSVPSNTRLYLGTAPLRTTVQADMVTAVASGEARALLDRPGSYELYLVDPDQRRKQVVGEFLVVQ